MNEEVISLTPITHEPTTKINSLEEVPVGFEVDGINSNEYYITFFNPDSIAEKVTYKYKESECKSPW